MKKILFISSTGGHLTELLQMSPIFPRYDSYIMTEKQKNNLFLKNKYGKDKVFFMIPGSYTGIINKLKYPVILLFNTVISFFVFKKIKPDCVITTGAHNSVPMCFIAHKAGCKVIFIETFAALEKPTKAGSMIYKIADHFIVQWENMLKFYPKAEFGGWIF